MPISTPEWRARIGRYAARYRPSNRSLSNDIDLIFITKLLHTLFGAKRKGCSQKSGRSSFQCSFVVSGDQKSSTESSTAGDTTVTGSASSSPSQANLTNHLGNGNVEWQSLFHEVSTKLVSYTFHIILSHVYYPKRTVKKYLHANGLRFYLKCCAMYLVTTFDIHVVSAHAIQVLKRVTLFAK